MSGAPAKLSRDQRAHTLRHSPATDPWPPPRISGDAAFDKDILGSVSEQIQKNFARTHWKVSVERGLWTWLEAVPASQGTALVASGLCGPQSLGAIAGAWPDGPLSPQRAFNATSFLRHIRKLGQSPESEEASGRRMARHSHPGLGSGQPPKW